MDISDDSIHTFANVKGYFRRNNELRSCVFRAVGTEVLDLEVISSGDCPRFRYLFDLQEPRIISLYSTLMLNESEDSNLFPSISDSYTNLLMLLTTVSISLKDYILARRAFFLVLTRTWNIAMRQHFPEGIDDSLLEMAIDMSQDELLKKHQTPFNLLDDYMLPKLLAPHTHTTVINPMRVMDLLHIETCRQIDNLFRRQYIVRDSETKQRRSITGIGAFYREVDASRRETVSLLLRIEEKRRESAG